MKSGPRSVRLVNGRIYRSAFDQTPADTLVVSEGKVAWSGGADAPGADDTVDLAGATVLPGLTDAHIHLFAIAQARLQVDVTPDEAASIAAVLTLLQARARSITAGTWVHGAGLDENGLAEKRLPTRAELDAALPDHPALIRRFCGHVAVANSAALRLFRIADDIADPEGGTFGRDSRGQLDGSAKESAAELMFRAVPPSNRADIVRSLRATIEDCTRLGLVAVVEAAVGFTSGFDDEFAVWRELRRGDPPRLRLGFMHQLDPSEARARGLAPGRDPRWQAMTLKYFADGIVGARTAAVGEDYADTPSRGFFMREEAELRRVISEAHAEGWQVAVHCVGDRATRCVIEAYEAAQAASPRPDPRHRIEHFFVPPAGGLARMRELGALVVMQPSFLTRMRRSILGAFGPRADRCYPGRSVLDAGARYVASSDAPTGAWSPWDGVADAVGRASDTGAPLGPLEAISVREAIDAYVQGGAFAMKHESWRGSLAPGMAADLIALDRDPFASGAGNLRQTRVLMTMIDGEIVHDGLTQRAK